MDKDELLQLVAARLVPVAHGETGDDGLASARDTHGSTAETRDKSPPGSSSPPVREGDVPHDHKALDEGANRSRQPVI